MPAWAGEPTERMKQTSDKVIAIVTDPALKVRTGQKREKT